MTCLVAGSGISGIGAAKLLLKKGAAVIVYDSNEKLNREDILQKLGEDPQTEVVLGELPQAVINCADLMVLSPGIAIDAPFVNRVREQGVPIWGLCMRSRESGRDYRDKRKNDDDCPDR